MLSVVRQHSRCVCQCLLQGQISQVNVAAKRNYENPNTHVFERVHDLNLVAVGKYPLIKRRHYLLKLVPSNPDYKTTMKCILTQEIKGVGLKGNIVEVPKRLFRNKLYPAGQAVYASPENLKLYESYRKDSLEEGIDYSTKLMMTEYAGYHLRVFMNPEQSWVLNTDHIRIAFRKQNVWLSNENIIPPASPVVQKGDFTFKIQIDDRLASTVRGTVYEVGPDGLPNPDIDYPDQWGHTPIDPENPLEYLKKLKSNTAQEDVNEQSPSEPNDGVKDA